jgi:hypothetical protein
MTQHSLPSCADVEAIDLLYPQLGLLATGY